MYRLLKRFLGGHRALYKTGPLDEVIILDMWDLPNSSSVDIIINWVYSQVQFQ